MEAKFLIDYLTSIANENLTLNLGMHLFVVAAFIALLLIKGEKPRQYILGGALLVLYLSVAVQAVIYGNPFHAVTFGILSLISGYSLTKVKTAVETPRALHISYGTITGFILLFLGLWYPELAAVNPAASILFSPVGIIPCPTLIVALGMTNFYRQYINKNQLLATVVFGVIYGFIGTFRLGVYFDIVLIIAVLLSLPGIIPGKDIGIGKWKLENGYPSVKR